MNPYQDLIDQYLFKQFPATPVSAATRFEAVSAAVFGTKQRRFGPHLSPEEQVKVRDVLKADGPVTFFLPWGASKQMLKHGLDVMELSALKQLACLRAELASYGKESRFIFRLEDLTDIYLLGISENARKHRMDAVDRYTTNFIRLSRLVLGNDADVRMETECVGLTQFVAVAESLYPAFYDYLRWGGEDKLAAVHALGWKGDLPKSQQQYYLDAYTQLGYREDQKLPAMARYFAATLARHKTGSTRVPTDRPFVVVAFTHPVPDNPVGTPRVYYRTIPHSYTNHHRSPWLAKGFLRIEQDGSVTPRVLLTAEEELALQPNRTTWNGVQLDLDYLVTD